jgi:hypothetical protein
MHNDALTDLLELDVVFSHPLVLGEIACGTPPNRIQTLTDLGSLQQAQQASVREVMDFIERERLFGAGCGLVDLMLLASALVTPGIELWTLDKRFAWSSRSLRSHAPPHVALTHKGNVWPSTPQSALQNCHTLDVNSPVRSLASWVPGVRQISTAVAVHRGRSFNDRKPRCKADR